MSLNEGTFLQSKWLNWYKGTTAGSGLTTGYIALFTTTPANDGTGGVEVSGGSYARQGLSGTSGWTAQSGSNPTAMKNNTAVNFPTATANWGTIVGVGVYDASTSGNLLWVGALTSSVVINSGDVLQFAANALVLNVNGAATPTGQQTNRLQWIRSFSFYSTISTMYLAAFTTTPALDGTGGVEVSGGSYARFSLTPSSFWGAITGATPSVISNAGTISFATATADWGTVLSIGLFSASSGGTMHALWTLSSSINVKSGHILTLNAGSLSLSEG
jgi:hypothetical protein